MKALLFSGGLDSSALAWRFRPDICLTVDYGQRAAQGEIVAASALAKAMNLPHELLRVDHSSLGSGVMSQQAPVESAQAPEFWPYRNQMLITIAAMALLSRGLKEIMIGAVGTDVHADGSPEFISAIDALLKLQEGGVRVAAPAVGLEPSDLLRSSGFPAELLGLTFSCHVHRYACGECGGCTKHRNVVEEAYGGAYSERWPSAEAE